MLLLFAPARRALALVLIAAHAPLVLRAAPKWPDLDPADLAAKSSSVDPDAGAEILTREIRLDDSGDRYSELKFYYRIKVYSENSLEHLSKIDIPFDANDDTVRNISARTHLPDGTVLELDNKDIFERDIVKANDVRQRVKSFAPPGLCPGAILEYRYTKFLYRSVSFVPFYFASDLPSREVHFILKPYVFIHRTANFLFFNAPNQTHQPDDDGYYHYDLTDVPASVDEPYQPPAIQCEPTVLMFYSIDSEADPAKYWNHRAAELYDATQSETKPSRPIRKTLADIVADSDPDPVKLTKIHDFCRTQIKNRYLDVSGYTDEQRQHLPRNHDPDDTLKHAGGDSYDIDALFIALARAAGFDARFAYCNNRSLFVYDSRLPEFFVMPDTIAAVKIGADWHYYDPSTTYLPPGMLAWENTGGGAVVADPRQSAAAFTPVDAPEVNFRRRQANLALDPDGNLDGDVAISYGGQWQARVKNLYDAETDDGRAKLIADALHETQPLAEVSAVKVINAADPIAPIEVRFHVHIPTYADHTGSRLFLQPAVFFKGAKPIFEAEHRVHDILFDFLSLSEDHMAITLPEAFELEAPSAPRKLGLSSLGDYDVHLTYNPHTRILGYDRALTLKLLNLSAAYYANLKAAFDLIHTQDNHVLTLKRSDTAASPANPPQS